MDLIYTDQNRIELGVLHEYSVDFDTTGEKDFQITVALSNNVLQGGYYWYIDGTEYGGRVDACEIKASNEVSYTGRNWRGILCSKIIQPPTGQDYKTLSGTLKAITDALISDAGLHDIYIADTCNATIENYKFSRYVSVYDGICAIAKSCGLVASFVVTYGLVHISYTAATDYTDDTEYNHDDLKFNIKRSYADVNHLICLGKGELKDRMVLHLYADANGNISGIQSIYGEDEVVATYENTNVDSIDELRSEGIQELKELNDTDSIELVVPDISMQIGDIVGGIERVTGTYVARPIVNIIVSIKEDKISAEYKVGEDSSASRSRSGESSTGGGGGGAPYTLPAATNTVLGGVKIGANLSMDTDGHLSAPAPVTVDDALSFTSDNAVKNKVVTQRLDEVFTSVSNGKALVAGAITDKGVQTASDATFEQMAANIALISSVVVRVDVENHTFKNVSESMGYVYYKSWWGGREGYRAFDGNEGTQWCCASKDSMQGEYLAYVFDRPIYLKKFKGYIKNTQGSNPVFKLQATLAYPVDDAVWVDLTDDIALAPDNNRLEFDFPQGEMYAAYRLYWSAGKQNASAGCDVWEINLYGYYYEQP